MPLDKKKLNIYHYHFKFYLNQWVFFFGGGEFCSLTRSVLRNAIFDTVITVLSCNKAFTIDVNMLVNRVTLHTSMGSYEL